MEETLGSQGNGIHLLVYLSQSKGLYSKTTTLKTRRGLQNRPRDKSTRSLGKAALGAPSFLDQPRQKKKGLLPAHHFMRQQDSAHFWVLILPFIGYGLSERKTRRDRGKDRALEQVQKSVPSHCHLGDPPSHRTGATAP